MKNSKNGIYLLMFLFVFCSNEGIQNKIDIIKITKEKAAKDGYNIDSCDISTISVMEFRMKYSHLISTKRYGFLINNNDELIVVMLKRKGYTKGGSVNYFVDKNGKIKFADYQK